MCKIDLGKPFAALGGKINLFCKVKSLAKGKMGLMGDDLNSPYNEKFAGDDLFKSAAGFAFITGYPVYIGQIDKGAVGFLELPAQYMEPAVDSGERRDLNAAQRIAVFFDSVPNAPDINVGKPAASLGLVTPDIAKALSYLIVARFICKYFHRLVVAERAHIVKPVEVVGVRVGNEQ